MIHAGEAKDEHRNSINSLKVKSGDTLQRDMLTLSTSPVDKTSTSS